MYFTLILENESGEQVNLSTTANQYMTSKIESACRDDFHFFLRRHERQLPQQRLH